MNSIERRQDGIESIQLGAAHLHGKLEHGVDLAAAVREDRDDVAVRLDREPRLAVGSQEQAHPGVVVVDIDCSAEAGRVLGRSDGCGEGGCVCRLGKRNRWETGVLERLSERPLRGVGA